MYRKLKYCVNVRNLEIPYHSKLKILTKTDQYINNMINIMFGVFC